MLPLKTNKISYMMFERSVALDFSSVLESCAFSDVTLIIDPSSSSNDEDQENPVKIRGHKVILATASEFFKELIDTDPTSDTIELKDMSPVMVQAAVQFMYSNMITMDESSVKDFIEVATKFKLVGFEAERGVKREAENDYDPEEGTSKKKKMKTDPDGNGEEDTKPNVVQKKTIEIPKFATLPDGRIRCLRCEKSFSHVKSVIRHFNEKHIGSSEQYGCYLCEKLFQFKRTLNEHLLKTHQISQRMLKQNCQK